MIFTRSLPAERPACNHASGKRSNRFLANRRNPPTVGTSRPWCSVVTRRLRKADGASFRTGANSSEVERFRVQLRNELLVKRFELAKSTRFSNLRLAAGADVNAVDPFGYTRLCMPQPMT